MAEYNIKRNGEHYGEVYGFNEAIAVAETVLDRTRDDKRTTVTVENKDGYLLASVTNRRIEGRFYKQHWGGYNGDDAIDVGEEIFDATDAVLLMSHEALLEMHDNRDSSDRIGWEHVSWAGPRYVRIVDSICAYFGVDDIHHITPDAFEFARQRVNPRSATYETITLSVTLQVRVAPGASSAGFVERMDSSFISNTPGVTVSDARIVASSEAGFL